jgi:hypothetical protein
MLTALCPGYSLASNFRQSDNPSIRREPEWIAGRLVMYQRSWQEHSHGPENVRTQLIGAREHWNLCLHEAAHAVVHIRQGGKVDRVEVYGKARPNSYTLGKSSHDDFSGLAVSVAGTLPNSSGVPVTFFGLAIR